MGTSWVAVSINNIKTRASREMTSRKNIKICNGVNVAKHWHVAGRGICHKSLIALLLHASCFVLFARFHSSAHRSQVQRMSEEIFWLSW